MKSRVKFTLDQIKAMHNFASRAVKYQSDYRDMKFLYNPNTPKDVYVKYTGYSLGDDNGIETNIEVVCVKPDGTMTDCYEQFDDLRQRMAFNADFVEIDLDERGKMSLA
jgi:hypothetical protein